MIATSDVLVPWIILCLFWNFFVLFISISGSWFVSCFDKAECIISSHVADFEVPLEHTHTQSVLWLQLRQFLLSPFQQLLLYIGNVHSHELGTANADVWLVVWTGTSSHMLCKVGTYRGFTGYRDDESVERYYAWSCSGNNIDTQNSYGWFFWGKERDLATRKGSVLGPYWDGRFEIIKKSAHPTWISCEPETLGPESSFNRKTCWMDTSIHTLMTSSWFIAWEVSTTNQRIQAAEYNESGKALGRLDWMERLPRDRSCWSLRLVKWLYTPWN